MHGPNLLLLSPCCARANEIVPRCVVPSQKGGADISDMRQTVKVGMAVNATPPHEINRVPEVSVPEFLIDRSLSLTL